MTDLKETAKRIFLDTLKAVEPESAIDRTLRIQGETLFVDDREMSLSPFDEVVLVGIGKAALRMAAATERVFGTKIKRGLVVGDRLLDVSVRSEVIIAGHPFPDSNSLIAGERIIEMVESCTERSLIVFLISGGGSSLVESLRSESISLEDLRLTNQVLVGCGATIKEINTIRKCLSRIKGGGLGRIARKSTCIALFISDVNPGDLRSIASNPLLPETVTNDDAEKVARRFDLIDKLPPSVVKALEVEGMGDRVALEAEEPKSPITVLLLDNSSAIAEAARFAEGLGFVVEVDVDHIEGQYRSVADRLLEQLLDLRSRSPKQCVCLISGGEVSCTVVGDGIGGRNQEFVLYSAARLASSSMISGVTVLSCGTDGIDGNSEAAGAVADAELIIKAAQRGLDASIFISSNDSNSFFKKSGGLIVTGPTGNNVRDLRILMAQ